VLLGLRFCKSCPLKKPSVADAEMIKPDFTQVGARIRLATANEL
jgi:hypothetical protein